MAGVSIILHEPEKSGNIGAVARAMKNFGFTPATGSQLIVLNPIAKVGMIARHYAVHAAELIDAAEVIRWSAPDEETKAEEIAAIFKRFDVVVGTSCRIFKEKYVYRIPVPIDTFITDLKSQEDLKENRIAVVFGPERSGLPNYVLKHVDMLVTIPTSPDYPSLNLSHAAAIFLYELSKLGIGGEVLIRGDIEPAPKEKIEVLLAKFESLLKIVRVPSYKWEKTMRSFRSILSRSHASGREIYLVIGVIGSALDLLLKKKDEQDGEGQA
jgi:tRNA/rRNA methyltransferase